MTTSLTVKLAGPKVSVTVIMHLILSNSHSHFLHYPLSFLLKHHRAFLLKFLLSEINKYYITNDALSVRT